MPYLTHFGLKDLPFTLTPDVEHYFPSDEHAAIISSLEFALRRDSGVVKIVGEVGTGKTLLCRLLAARLIATESVAYINVPRANERSMVLTVCSEFGIKFDSDRQSPYDALNHFLVDVHAKGKMAVVLVDEAQHLGREGLEAIRLLSNLETDKNKLLQIVLFGQTELDDFLAEPGLRQLNQRVAFSFYTKPLSGVEVKRYVTHRVNVSRREGMAYDLFEPAAIDVIAKRSRGIPRVINILADKCLLAAFSKGSPVVKRCHAQMAVKDSASVVSKSAGASVVEILLRFSARFGFKIAAVSAMVLAAWLWRSGAVVPAKVVEALEVTTTARSQPVAAVAVGPLAVAAVVAPPIPVAAPSPEPEQKKVAHKVHPRRLAHPVAKPKTHDAAQNINPPSASKVWALSVTDAPEGAHPDAPEAGR